MSQSSCDQRGHTCKVLPRLQGLWSGQPGHTRRTGGGEGWGRHSTPRGRPAPQHPQPRREMSSGAGEHAWVEKLPRLLPLETPLPGSPGPQLVLITLTGSRTCCGGAPSPPQSQPCRQKQTSPRFPLPARLGCARGGCADRDSTPHPARSPACCGLSSSARLLMGTPRPSPPPWHCQSSFQNLETHPPCPLYHGTQTIQFLCVQSVW